MLRQNNNHRFGNNHKSRVNIMKKSSSVKIIPKPQIIIKKEFLEEPRELDLSKNEILIVSPSIPILNIEATSSICEPLELHAIEDISNNTIEKTDDLGISILFEDIYEDEKPVEYDETEVLKPPIKITPKKQSSYNKAKFKAIVYSALTDFYYNKEDW